MIEHVVLFNERAGAPFDDLAALERYRVHPAHQAVLQSIREICHEVLVYDQQA